MELSDGGISGRGRERGETEMDELDPIVLGCVT